MVKFHCADCQSAISLAPEEAYNLTKVTCGRCGNEISGKVYEQIRLSLIEIIKATEILKGIETNNSETLFKALLERKNPQLQTVGWDLELAFYF